MRMQAWAVDDHHPYTVVKNMAARMDQIRTIPTTTTVEPSRVLRFDQSAIF